jgi:hypothetical protein
LCNIVGASSLGNVRIQCHVFGIEKRLDDDVYGAKLLSKDSTNGLVVGLVMKL